MRRAFALFALAAALLTGCDTNNIVQPIVSVPLDSLTVSPDSATIRVGDTRSFTVAAIDTGGSVVTDPVLQWASGNTSVFSVNGAGVVRGLNEGVALLYVASGGKVDSALIMVLPATRGWFDQPTGTASTDLNDVFADAGGNRVWAVGDGGRILASTTAGRTWTVQGSNTGAALRSVWFTSASEGWAVGDAGTIRRTTNGGTTWLTVLAGLTSYQLHDVFFATRDIGWVVGSGGLIARTGNRGVTWTQKFPTPFTLRAVSFSDTSFGWAVGDGGVIVGSQDGGRSWYLVQPTVTTQNLRGVSRRYMAPPPTPSLRRTAPMRSLSLFDLAIAAGSQGVTPRAFAGSSPDSAAWELLNAGALNQFEDVQVVSDSTAWAVGFNGNGLVLRTDDIGETWAPQATGTLFRLNGVYFIDRNRGWAVGANGVVLHTVTGGQP